jgi:hypothetical protein
MNLQDIAVLALTGELLFSGASAVNARCALPRRTAVEAELAAEADGDDGADIGDFHENLPPALSISKASFRRIESAAVPVVCTLQGSSRSARL